MHLFQLVLNLLVTSVAVVVLCQYRCQCVLSLMAFLSLYFYFHDLSDAKCVIFFPNPVGGEDSVLSLFKGWHEALLILHSRKK